MTEYFEEIEDIRITGKIKLPFGFKHNDKYVLPLKAGTNEIIATKTF